MFNGFRETVLLTLPYERYLTKTGTDFGRRRNQFSVLVGG